MVSILQVGLIGAGVTGEVLAVGGQATVEHCHQAGQCRIKFGKL